MSLTVSNLGAEVGLSADTVRYYERLGLLPAPARTAAGYRQYGADAVEAICDQGLCPCGHTEALLRRRMAELDAQLAELRAVRAELARMVDDHPGAACEDTAVGRWWCEQEFIQLQQGR